MATTTASRRKAAKSPPAKREHIISVRIDSGLLEMLGELAEEMDRSKASVLARAVREYVEREHAALMEIRAGERDADEGRTVSVAEARAWLKDRREGKVREPRYGE